MMNFVDQLLLKCTPGKLFLFGVVPFLVLLRSTTLWTHICDLDEAAWSIAAWKWIEDGGIYLSFIDIKPPGVYIFFAAVFRVFKTHSLLWIHAITIIWVAINAWVIFILGKTIKNEKTGLIAAFLFACFGVYSHSKILSTNTETLLNLPLTLSVMFLFFSEKKSLLHIFKYSICFGFFAGIACAFKFQAAIIFGVWAVHILFYKFNFKKIIVDGLGVLIGFAMVGFFLYLFMHEQNGFEEFVYWVWKGSFSYIGSGTVYPLKFQILRISLFILFFHAVLLLFFICIRCKTFKSLNLQKKPFLLVLSWAFFTTFAVVAGWRFYPHYFIMWNPAIAILAALAIQSLASSQVTVHSRFKKIGSENFFLNYFLIMSLGVFCFNVIEPTLKLGYQNDLIEVKKIASFVQNNSSKNDRIMVWGLAADLHYFSERLPAHRFVWGDQLIGRGSLPGNVGSEWYEKRLDPYAWELWSKDISRTPPALIIDYSSTSNFSDMEFYPIKNYPKLKNYLENEYVFLDEIDGIDIYKRK